MRLTYDYSGSVAVVTGAARGVGQSMVRALSAAGAGVVAADRDEQGLGETCEGLTDVIPVVADVSAAAGAAGIVGTAVRALGRLDYAASR